MSNKRTPMIHFERQLLPQPPADAEPYFCYINTLIFYDKNHKEIWRQLIPEADQLIGFQTLEEYNKLEARHGQHKIRVEYEAHFGWILKFSIAHDNAKAIWKILFPQVTFDRPVSEDDKVIVADKKGMWRIVEHSSITKEEGDAYIG